MYALIAGTAAVLSATAMLSASAAAEAHRRILLEYENLTGGQMLSAGPFVTHQRGMHLWQEGERASLEIRQLAEEGNPDWIAAGAVLGDGMRYGGVVISIPALPGQKRRMELAVTEAHPQVSGAFMLSATNDAFAGIDAVDAYALSGTVTFDVFALDAGTSQNIETKAFLRAYNGLGREPEGEVITRHIGMKAGGDVPEFWRFDPSKPVARFTITPVSSAGTDR